MRTGTVFSDGIDCRFALKVTPGVLKTVGEGQAGQQRENPVIAVDQGSGAAVIGYRNASSGAHFFRRILPSLGAPQVMPQAKTDALSIAARAGGATAPTPRRAPESGCFASAASRSRCRCRRGPGC